VFSAARIPRHVRDDVKGFSIGRSLKHDSPQRCFDFAVAAIHMIRRFPQLVSDPFRTAALLFEAKHEQLG
jgi:hypothetical protein